MKTIKTKIMPPWIINLFFIIGLVSALLFRILIFFNTWLPAYGRIIWYAGVIGYIFFFAFRFFISYRRKKTIRRNNLIEKLMASNLADDDRDEIIYIMNSLLKSREMINYIFIFSISAVTIIADLLLSWLR